MLGNIIFTVLIIVLIGKLLRNLKNGIILYIILSLISPHLKIGNLQISYEIMAFFPVFIIVIIKKRAIFLLYRKYLYRQHLIIFFYIYLLSSFLATLQFGSKIPWLTFFSIFRIIITIFILQFVMKENSDQVLDHIISPVLFINLVTSIIQLAIPSSTKLFYELYYKASLSPLADALELGYFNRAYGTFGTPVLLGIFSIFCFAVYLGFFTEKKKCKKIYLKLVSSIIIGLLALSKTAILGVPTIFICCCLLILIGVIKINNKKIIVLPLLLIPIFIVTVQLLRQHGTTINYYIRFLSKPFEALSTRYDASSGILADAYSTISGNWLFGVGGTPLGNDFIGDSMYLEVMYSTGIIGIIIYFSALIRASITNLKLRNVTALLCFIAICLGGFAAPVQLHFISVSLLAYMFSNAESLYGINVKSI